MLIFNHHVRVSKKPRTFVKKNSSVATFKRRTSNSSKHSITKENKQFLKSLGLTPNNESFVRHN